MDVGGAVPASGVEDKDCPRAFSVKVPVLREFLVALPVMNVVAALVAQIANTTLSVASLCKASLDRRKTLALFGSAVASTLRRRGSAPGKQETATHAEPDEEQNDQDGQSWPSALLASVRRSWIPFATRRPFADSAEQFAGLNAAFRAATGDALVHRLCPRNDIGLCRRNAIASPQLSRIHCWCSDLVSPLGTQ